MRRIDAATGTMRVRARFDNPDGVLQPGMFGRINVPGSLPYKGVMVPDEAIGADQNRRIVYVVDAEGNVSAKPVRTTFEVQPLGVGYYSVDLPSSIEVDVPEAWSLPLSPYVCLKTTIHRLFPTIHPTMKTIADI